MLARKALTKEDASVIDNFHVTTSHLNAAINRYTDAALKLNAGLSEEAELSIAIAQRHIRIAQLTQESLISTA